MAESEEAERSLLALAAPESLTDPLAHDLLRVALDQSVDPEPFVGALHLCDFVVERNSEWHLAAEVREVLVERLIGHRDLSDLLHQRLLSFTKPGSVEEIPPELPRYLTEGVGRAYHATFLSPDGLSDYVRVAKQPISGQQWLAGNLASEQVRLGVIPENAIEVLFLRGMILYREHRRREAELLLRQVAESPEQRFEVAVSSHLIGRMDGRRFRTRKRGESLLWKSLEIGRKIGDAGHQAQVLHTLGQLIGRDPKRREEAEGLLRESLEREPTMNDPLGRAQVLHTLGQLIGRDPGRRDEAEGLLRESLKMGQKLDERDHEARVLHTLGQMVGLASARRDEAEGLLRESLKIEETMHNALGRAQVLHTLGQLIGRNAGRRDEAEGLLRESLEIGQKLDNLNHQAQVLYGLARLKGTSPEVAKALLLESLDLNRQIENKSGERIVRKALSKLSRNASA